MRYCRFLAFGVISSLAGVALGETVRGVLVDPAGKPVAGAVLHGYASEMLGRGNQRVTELKAVSDASGAFQIANAPSTPTADIPILLMAHLVNGHYARVALAADGATVTVVDRPVRLKMTVTDAKGSPIAGAKLKISNLWVTGGKGGSPPLSYGGTWWEADPRLTGTSDAHGVAEVNDLPGGEGAMYAVDKPGMVEVRGPANLPKDGEVATTAQLVKGAILTGRVLEQGKPVGGISVMALSRGKYMYETYLSTTDASGTFRIENCPAGDLKLKVDLGERQKDWTVKPYEDLHVAAGGELDGLNFVLEKGIVVTGTVRTLALNRPVPGARVSILTDRVTPLDVTTDAEGKYSGRVAPGPCYVSVSEVAGRRTDGHYNLQANVDAKHNPPFELHVPDVLLLDPIPHLTGTVVNAAGGPVADAVVLDLSSDARATTDASGAFRFSGATNPGDQIVATKGESVSKLAVTLTEKTSVSLRLDSKLAAIEGKVTDEKVHPIAGVEISLGGKFWGARSVTTDATGRYKFTDLFAGPDPFYVWAKKGGYGSTTIQPITLVPGETKTLDEMEMRLADGVIDGKVFEADGRPAKGATVSSQTQESANVQTDDEGRFHLTNVPRGHHFVVAGRDNAFGEGAQAETGDKDVVIRLTKPHGLKPGEIVGDKSGQAAPELKFASWVNGKSVDLASLRGKVVVVDFWAVWCGPCVEALPKVEALAEKYQKQGVVVIGVHAVGTPLAAVEKFVKQHRLTYPIGLDFPDESGLGASAAKYVPRGIPSVFVIAPDGRIVSDSNEIDVAEKAVQALVAAKS
jgi:thiol-disulfide isomerase/thioredoxin